MSRLLLIGLALFALGTAGSMLMGRHDEVVAVGNDGLCDRVGGFFSHCYPIAPENLLPRPEPLPSASPSVGGCWGLCERGDLPRPPGTPELDAWTTRDCTVQAVQLGGRFSATPFGYALLWSPLLMLAGLLFAALGLRGLHPEPPAGVERLAAGIGTVPIPLLAALVVITPVMPPGQSWLGWVVVSVAGLAVLGVLSALAIVAVGAIRRRRAGGLGTGSRAWLEAAVSAGLLGIVVAGFVLIGAGHMFGC